MPTRTALSGYTAAALILAASFVALRPADAEAQLLLGVHGVQASETLDGTNGIGARGGIDAPLLPFQVFASAEYFFPDCDTIVGDDCSFWGASIEANVGLPIPILSPYVTGGFAYRSFDFSELEDPHTSSGAVVGAGLNVGLGGLRAFGEARYEFVDAPDKQVVMRIGVLLGVP